MAISMTPIGWDQAIIPRAAAWLQRQSELSEALVIAPTARAGRRLRECLAERAPSDAAWMPPTFATSSSLLDLLAPPQMPLASQAQLRLIATEVLLDMDEAEALWRRPEQDELAMRSAWFTAQGLLTALATVASAGRSVQESLELAELDSPRHQALAEWEALLDDALEQHGLCRRDKQAAASPTSW